MPAGFQYVGADAKVVGGSLSTHRDDRIVFDQNQIVGLFSVPLSLQKFLLERKRGVLIRPPDNQNLAGDHGAVYANSELTDSSL